MSRLILFSMDDCDTDAQQHLVERIGEILDRIDDDDFIIDNATENLDLVTLKINAPILPRQHHPFYFSVIIN